MIVILPVSMWLIHLCKDKLKSESQPLRSEHGTSAWCRRAVSDGKSPAHSPLDPTWALIAAYGDTQPPKIRYWHQNEKSVRVFSKLSEPVPEPVQKSQPAHCQWAGRDIFGWLALLWVGRDLETEEGIRKLILSLKHPMHQYVYE